LEKINVTNHVIICGWNKHGRRIIQTIDNLAHGEKEIVLINDLSEEKVTALRSRFRQIKLYFVSGDFTRENILEKASIRDSQTVVVIPNETDTILSSPDEKTIFATMTIKSIDPNIRVVAYLMDKENLTHMKRTNVDEVVVSDDFGAYMVASHVIETGVPQTISHLLDETAASRFICHKIPKDFIGRPFSALSDHFRNEGGLILVGVFSIEENLGINSILSADSSSLDAFIEHKLKEGGISLQEAEKVSTVINPHEEYLISDSEQAVVIS
jgi:voltage-gated potassium channel